MDRSWMKQPRVSEAYDRGVKSFIEFAFEKSSYEGKIVCPCKKCRLALPISREVAYEHLISDGFMDNYTTWFLHGEQGQSSSTSNEGQSYRQSNMDIDSDGLLHEAFGIPSSEHDTETDTPNQTEDEPNAEAATFYNFLKDAKKDLYPGCKKFTKLSFIIRLFHIKCLSGWSNNSFGMLLDLLKEVLPEGETLPNSFYEMKKIIKKLGLSYEKIDACPNDCILYRKEHQEKKECPKCGSSRYVQPESNATGSSTSDASTNVSAKVLRYFPLISRLQRLYMSSKTASLMTWHKNDRKVDGKLRHPADSPAWLTFDHKNEEFSREPRNVRLGLASDGFNPFRTMSTTYSIWPVILMVYNLPPWMCMNKDNLILSMIILGPGSPGNNIDVYLQPLIDELKLLWENGVQTYDVSTKSNFQMRASLLWTISDLPALAYLSGWSTKGKYACIFCHKETCSMWLKHGRKFCYMGHRRFLDKKHAFRNNEKDFDGTKERRLAPKPLDGSMILEMLEGYEMEYGKTSVNLQLPYSWKKRSIFFELPYWKDNVIRHNLDVMHIEKNVCESILGTLLNLEGKTKDGLNARLDLELMGLKPELQPRHGPNNKIMLPPACFSLKKEEKVTFCKFLKKLRVPDGYAANISRCVNIKDKKIFGLKSHDCHILIQQILPLAVRGMLTSNVQSCLIELSNFFREIYSKVNKPQDLTRLEHDISITLCKLEKIFPPSFFDIVVHLLVHLPREAMLAGPVQYRHMYPIERYLLKLKTYVKSRSHPEGCIAEAYLVDECLTFCSRYMEGVETRLNRPSRNNDDGGIIEGVLPIFSMPGRPLGKGQIKTLDETTMTKAHRYVLINCDTVQPFKEQHLKIISEQYSHLTDWQRDNIHNEQFPAWFANQVNSQLTEDDIFCEDLKAIARGPQRHVTSYKKYMVNGFRFHTKEIEAKRKTQNSGVIIGAETRSFATKRDSNPVTGAITYYGVLTDIIELDYLFDKRIVLFKCDWVSRRGQRQENNCMLVNFNHLIGDNDPFILASQAEQVMYIEDLKRKDWHIAIKFTPRHFYDMNAQSSVDDRVESYLQSVIFGTTGSQDDNISNLLRPDMPPIIVDAPMSSEQDTENFGNNIGDEEELDLLF